MKKRWLCLLLCLLLTGCVPDADQAAAPSVPVAESRESTETDGDRPVDKGPGTFLPPEGDYQLPPQPSGPEASRE